MKPLYLIKKEDAKLHIAKGNNKIGAGIYAFSTLPGNDKHMMYISNNTVLLTDIPGTCSRFCDGCAKDGCCYAWRDAKLHHNVTIKAWAENTLLLRAGKAISAIDDYITSKNKKYNQTHDIKDAVVKTFRINVSGEVESLEQFEGWNGLAIKHPEVAFGIYTKNFDDLEKFIIKHQHTADNLCVNVSQWNHVADDFLKKYPGQFNVFEYDETNKKACDWSEEDRSRLSQLKHCPAVNPDGHHAKTADGKPITCDMCRRCYRKTGQTTAVYSH